MSLRDSRINDPDNQMFGGVKIISKAVSVKPVKQDCVFIQHDDVNETLIPVAAFYTENVDFLSIQMEVVVNALDQFVIKYRYSEDGPYISRVSAALDFTTPNAPVLSASGSFLTAAVSDAHFIKLDVAGVYAVQLWAASGNAAGSKVKFNAGTK